MKSIKLYRSKFEALNPVGFILILSINIQMNAEMSQTYLALTIALISLLLLQIMLLFMLPLVKVKNGTVLIFNKLFRRPLVFTKEQIKNIECSTNGYIPKVFYIKQGGKEYDLNFDISLNFNNNNFKSFIEERINFNEIKIRNTNIKEKAIVIKDKWLISVSFIAILAIVILSLTSRST